MMASSVRFMGMALIAFALASSVAEAQTEAQMSKPSTIHTPARHRHHAETPKEEGREITVQRSTPSWLTLGQDTSVGSGNGYVLETFDQPSPAQGTFMGYRGRERVVNQYGDEGAPVFRF
jgi:hypothetical protein